jgi:hypothetical protein
MKPSSRVRLEVEILDDDQSTPAPMAPAAFDEGMGVTALVVAAEADLRRYVRECLRERIDLRLLEAATVIAAVALAAYYSLAFLVVDEPESEVLAALPGLRAIVLVDDVPHRAAALGARHRLLARPFTAERLLAEVSQLLR